MLTELILSLLAFMVIDRSSFWYMGNTFAQFSGKNVSFSYRQTVIPRYIFAIIGCVLFAWGESSDSDDVSTAGLLLIAGAVVALSIRVIRSFYRERQG